MSLSRTAWGDQVSEYGTDQLYPLNTLREDVDGTYGLRIFRYVKIDAGITTKVGYGVMKKAGTALALAILSGVATPVARMLGVCQVVIPASNYGWVLCDGVGLIATSAAGCSADTQQKAVALGQFTDGVVVDGDTFAFAHAAGAAVADTLVVATIRML